MSSLPPARSRTATDSGSSHLAAVVFFGQHHPCEIELNSPTNPIVRFVRGVVWFNPAVRRQFRLSYMAGQAGLTEKMAGRTSRQLDDSSGFFDVGSYREM